MKQYYNALFIVVTVLSLVAAGCKKDKISVGPESITFPGVGGTQTLTVDSNTDWTPMPEAPWLTVSKMNATNLRIEAAPNTTFSNRSAIVRCMAGSAAATITVSQADLPARQVDSLWLIDLYNATNGGSWKGKWLWSSPITQWQGVTVINERVARLSIPDNNLSGPLPESIANLTALQYLDLSGNHFTGVVPAGINQLTQLWYLDLSENNLSGSFPAIPALTQLLIFDISSNAFTALPALNMLTQLEYLAFCNNDISGSLPANLSALTKLIYLDGSVNRFTGNIPAAWSSLTKMRVFYCYANTLTGNIPDFLTNFTDLEALALHANNLTGSIPYDLGNLSQLGELWLAQNQLTGAIPAPLLANPHWSEWKPNVCPQQSTYGFTGSDCSGSGAPVAPKSTIAKQIKSKYKQSLTSVK